MRKANHYLLWLFVFTVPWDVVALPGVGSISRAFGVGVIGAALLTTALEGRFRKPDAIFTLAIMFTISSALSLLWTISYPTTVQRVWTYTQLLGSVWVVRELARTREQQQSLLLAFCLGAFVPMVSLLSNFRSDTGLVSGYTNRFTASGFNADNLGLMLVIGIPMAWHLILRAAGTARAIAVIYFALAPVAILLTGTRGAFLAGLVAMSIVPLTLTSLSRRTVSMIAVLLVVLAATAAIVVPKASWERLATIQTELTEGGKMTGRRNIWQAGLIVFPEHPLLGVGAGAYAPAIAPYSKAIVSHNVPLGLLVEQGIVGLSIFLALLTACAVTIFRMDSPDRKLWAVVMLSWLIGIMSLNWENVKATWFLFGLVAAQDGVQAVHGRLSQSRRKKGPRHASEPAVRLQPAYSNPVAQRGSTLLTPRS